MPESGDLPYDLRPLTHYPPIKIRHRRFDSDVEHLITELEQHLGVETNNSVEGLMRRSARRFPNWFWFFFVLLVVGVSAILVWSVRIKIPPSESANIVVTPTSSKTRDNSVLITKTGQPELPTSTATKSPPATSTSPPTTTIPATLTPSPRPTSTDAYLPLNIVDLFGIQMVQIPQGPFTLGTDENDPWDIVSRPAHVVGLDVFYIDKYEVSNARYKECVEAGLCSEPLEKRTKTRLSYYDDPEYVNYPVVYVSWEDAQTYCSWRGGRLPREAEWEKAAKGEEQRSYPWGDSDVDCQHANFWPDAACIGDTLPVDGLAAGSSPYGVLNMSGNVQEWVSDWFQAYPGGDPTATREYGITHRVIRGGAYFDGSFYIQTTTRKGLKPDSAYSYVGFRCVIEVEALP
jgi:formylglycine-generating enzyme required for sulfatase activity